MPIQTAIITGTTPTSTGTKSFEEAGFGTPQAVLIIFGGANTTTNPESHSRIGYGCTDGTNENYCTISSQNGKATSDTANASSVTKCIGLIETDGASSVILEGGFDSWATNGITIDFTTADTVAHDISIMLIKGCTNVKAFSETLSTTGVNDITSIGFKGNLMYAWTVGETAVGMSNSAKLTFGAIHNNSSDVVSQGCIVHSNVHNQAASLLSGAIYNDAFIARHYWNATQWKGSGGSFDASGFSVDTGSDSPLSNLMFGLIMDTGDTDGVKVSIEASPTATGDWSVTSTGFTPQSALLGQTLFSAVNTIYSIDPVGAFGFGLFDDTNESFIGIAGDDADSGNTSEESIFSSANAVNLRGWNGSAFADRHVGSFSSMNANGYTINLPTTADGTERQWLSVAIEEGVQTVTSDLSITLPSINIAMYAGVAGAVGFSDSFNIAWNIANNSDFDTSWNIHNSESQSTSWNILNQVTNDVAWNISGGNDYNVAWFIDGRIPTPDVVFQSSHRNSIFKSTFRQSIFKAEKR